MVSFFLTLLVGVPVCMFAYFRGTKRKAESFNQRYKFFFTLLFLFHVVILAAIVTSAKPLDIKSFASVIVVLLYCIVVGAWAVVGGCYAAGARKKAEPVNTYARWYAFPLVMVLVVAGIAAAQYYYSAQYLTPDYEIERIDEEVQLDKYRPFHNSNQVAKANFAPNLIIDRDYPRLDGATAAFPMYAAVVETVYQNLDEQTVKPYIACSKTPQAYKRLINGETDIIFGAEPSQAHIDDAAAQGVQFILTKISREAFVFFVNKDNPVNELTTEQIRNIYTKRAVNWQQVGGADEKIIPFQRPLNSGSQTVMMQQVMKTEQLAAPLEEERVVGMGGIIYQVAGYRNYHNAIGYSFHYYATAMNANSDIKLVAINGIAPTKQSIASGQYPYTVDVYAVTTDKSMQQDNVKKLLSWLVAEQGQQLVELCGYSRIGR